MKKVLLILSALLITLTVSAQSKEKVLKALDKAIAATQDEKKSSKPATWIKLSDAYLKVYKAERDGLTPGVPRNIIGSEGVISTENRTVTGTQFIIDVYADKEIFYTQEETLAAARITESFLGKEKHPLVESINALIEAINVDEKKSKSGAIEAKLQILRNTIIAETNILLAIEDYSTTSKLYAAATKCIDNNLIGGDDEIMIFSAAKTADFSGDYATAKKFYEKALSIGFYSKGDAFISLANIYSNEKNFDKAKEVLNLGLQKMSENQQVLVNLIQLYIDTNDDVNKILTLLHEAQKNEPNNVSLYNAEASVYDQRGETDKAAALYSKAFEIDPSNAWSIFSAGAAFYNKAIDLAAAQSELPLDDQEGYDKLSNDIEKYLLASIEPFEKAFEGAGEDMELKMASANTLKQVYFRFREVDAKYQVRYDKYNSFLEANK